MTFGQRNDVWRRNHRPEHRSRLRDRRARICPTTTRPSSPPPPPLRVVAAGRVVLRRRQMNKPQIAATTGLASYRSFYRPKPLTKTTIIAWPCLSLFDRPDSRLHFPPKNESRVTQQPSCWVPRRLVQRLEGCCPGTTMTTMRHRPIWTKMTTTSRRVCFIGLGKVPCGGTNPWKWPKTRVTPFFALPPTTMMTMMIITQIMNDPPHGKNASRPVLCYAAKTMSGFNTGHCLALRQQLLTMLTDDDD
jgi:hypothetical protein